MSKLRLKNNGECPNDFSESFGNEKRVEPSQRRWVNSVNWVVVMIVSRVDIHIYIGERERERRSYKRVSGKCWFMPRWRSGQAGGNRKQANGGDKNENEWTTTSKKNLDGSHTARHIQPPHNTTVADIAINWKMMMWNLAARCGGALDVNVW